MIKKTDSNAREDTSSQPYDNCSADNFYHGEGFDHSKLSEGIPQGSESYVSEGYSGEWYAYA